MYVIRRRIVPTCNFTFERCVKLYPRPSKVFSPSVLALSSATFFLFVLVQVHETLSFSHDHKSLKIVPHSNYLLVWRSTLHLPPYRKRISPFLPLDFTPHFFLSTFNLLNHDPSWNSSQCSLQIRNVRLRQSCISPEKASMTNWSVLEWAWLSIGQRPLPDKNTRFFFVDIRNRRLKCVFCAVSAMIIITERT